MGDILADTAILANASKKEPLCKQSMINQLSNPITRNRSVAKISKVMSSKPHPPQPTHRTPNCLSLCQTCQNKSQARNELVRKNKLKLECPSIEPILSCNKILLSTDKETLALWCLTTGMNDLDSKR